MRPRTLHPNAPRTGSDLNDSTASSSFRRLAISLSIQNNSQPTMIIYIIPRINHIQSLKSSANLGSLRKKAPSDDSSAASTGLWHKMTASNAFSFAQGRTCFRAAGAATHQCLSFMSFNLNGTITYKETRNSPQCISHCCQLLLKQRLVPLPLGDLLTKSVPCTSTAVQAIHVSNAICLETTMMQKNR